MLRCTRCGRELVFLVDDGEPSALCVGCQYQSSLTYKPNAVQRAVKAQINRRERAPQGIAQHAISPELAAQIKAAL